MPFSSSHLAMMKRHPFLIEQGIAWRRGVLARGPSPAHIADDLAALERLRKELQARRTGIDCNAGSEGAGQ